MHSNDDRKNVAFRSSPERRLRILACTPELIVAIATTGPKSFTVENGLPDGVKALHSFYDAARGYWGIVCEHPSFFHVPEGQSVPLHEGIIFKKENPPPHAPFPGQIQS